MKRLDFDILILGAGGAGLFAALHAHKADATLKIAIAVKGLLGKSGCTRMVQGGYNVALAPGDSAVRHFMDTVEGGKWLNDQDLAWLLVHEAQTRIRELENELGCFFDRNADGTVHQKAFAGQTFDRTVHKGDLTGIEIVNRLAEQVWTRGISRLEEHRALAFVKTPDGAALSGVLMLEIRTGEFLFVRAKAVLLATGGGPTMYKYHTPSGDKACDGMAMALRAGLALRDMEMVQFHPTGLLAGPDTRMTGTVLEEGLRGAGGWLTDRDGKRFMAEYDPKAERATRDVVSRSIADVIAKGRGTDLGGVYIEMAHLGPAQVKKQFKGMVERCADCGFDLGGGRVQVVPTAHYMMGGVPFAPDCTTALPGLFAAGEDTGGVHGANRLGGNGVANSTVFGGLAGASMAEFARGAELRSADESAISAAMEAALAPFAKPPGDLDAIREKLYDTMWNDVGIVRDAAGLARGAAALAALDAELDRTGVADGDRAFNLTWHDWLNLKNLVAVSKIVCAAAQARTDSRGAHFRSDHPATDDLATSRYTLAKLENGAAIVTSEAVQFTRVRPGQTLLPAEAAE